MPLGLDFCMRYMCTGSRSRCLSPRRLLPAVGHPAVGRRGGSRQRLWVPGHDALLLPPPPCSPSPSVHLPCLTARSALLVLRDPQGRPGPHAGSRPRRAPAPAASCPPAAMLPAQRGAAQCRSLPSRRSPSCQALQHAAGLGRTRAGERGRAEPPSLLPAQQGTACAPPGTGMGVLPPRTTANASLLPLGTQETLGCCGGARPAPGCAHIRPQGKRRAGAGGRL